MTDVTIEPHWTEDASLIGQIADETFEAAADMMNKAAYTFGACTGLSLCPSERRYAPAFNN